VQLPERRWSQVEEEDFEGSDSAQAFSWQNVSVPGKGSIDLRAIAKFGPFETNWLRLELEFSGVSSQPIYYENEISATGILLGNGTGSAGIVLVVDGDVVNLQWLDESFEIGEVVDFNFSAAGLGIGEGPHALAFYAVDSDGNVGAPVTLTLTVIAPTASASGTPVATSTPTRFATQTPAPANVSMSVWPSPASFDITGNDDRIRTSYGGYYALLRVNGSSGIIKGATGAEIDGVLLSFHPTLISENAVLLAFRLQNGADSPRVADVGVSADVFFDGNDGAIISQIEPGDGFIIASPDNALTFLLRDSTLVTSVDTFWYGERIDGAHNNWTQTTANSVAVEDSAFTFSWQNLSLAPGEIQAVSVIAKFGFENAPVGLILTFPVLPDGVLFYQDTITISGQVTATGPVSLLVTVDDPSFAFELDTGPYEPDVPISFPFTPVDHAIGEGLHIFSFYAVDSIGNVSPPQSFSASVIAPTDSPTWTVPATQTPAPSASPYINVPLSFAPNPESFDLFGTIGNHTIRTTSYGYTATLRIGNETAFITGLKPAALAGVNLSLGFFRLSANALLLDFTVSNENEDSWLVDISVSSDINFEGYDDAPCAVIPGGHGFNVFSPANTLSFVTGRSPFVTDVSTFWFGALADRRANEWTQVATDSFSGADSAMAFTWQGIAVSGQSWVKRSVIIKFGGFNSSPLDLSVTLATSTVLVNTVVTVTGTVLTPVLPTSPEVRLFFVPDADETSLTEFEASINSQFTADFELTEMGLGPHTLGIVAVDSDGDISEENILAFTVVNQLPSTYTPTAESGSSGLVLTVVIAAGAGLLLVGGVVVGASVLWRRHRRPKAHDRPTSVPEGDQEYMYDRLVPKEGGKSEQVIADGPPRDAL
jgi:hypothetical protein